VKTSDLMYKLQMGLKKNGYIISISTNQWYNPELDKYFKQYVIKHNKKILIKSCSQIKIVKYLAELLKEIKNG